MGHETVCGLDIGTTKTCAVVAVNGPRGLEIVGVGEAPSQGMRKGVVIDLEATVHSIEAAAEKAERMAGIHVGNVFVGSPATICAVPIITRWSPSRARTVRSPQTTCAG